MTERKNEISGNSEMEKECKTYEKGNRKPTREEFHEYSQVSARCSTRLLEKKEWVNKIVVASELGINQLNVYNWALLYTFMLYKCNYRSFRQFIYYYISSISPTYLAERQRLTNNLIVAII
uniref:Uncharacterized protein n=1 Tax=Rhizophagus irregularis (strain DAOM 181602 / DAOM 197198 / MUCL 43194) TaxID=747089 RepID=U9UW15_RHIID